MSCLVRSARLRVPDLEECVRFYTGVLGMRCTRAEESARLETAGRGCAEAALVLEGGGRPRTASRDDLYWKIGILLPDVDAALEVIRARGAEVSEPAQFEDIGYLCHLEDPAGLQIELLQHTFEGSPAGVRTRGSRRTDPLAEATLGHVTLRTADPEGAIAYYEGLGMSLVSRQPVSRYGFVLYFLAPWVEPRPRPELEAVENREWLWQRPYTCLELQARDEASPVTRTGADETGLLGIDLARGSGSGAPGAVAGPDGVRISLCAPDGAPSDAPEAAGGAC